MNEFFQRKPDFSVLSEFGVFFVVSSCFMLGVIIQKQFTLDHSITQCNRNTKIKTKTKTKNV